MIYLFGVVGFIGGFVVGQMILLRLLKGRSKDDLLKNKHIHWTYGLLNWGVAGIGAYAAVAFYELYVK